MDIEKIKELLQTAVVASVKAGQEILNVYNSDFTVEQKDDRSPLTLADKNAHKEIVEFLEGTGLPVLSEEGRDIPYQERKDWEYFWMVDPLDGTKEFVKRNGEFTVNIALIHNGNPIAGVIYVPVKKWLYFGGEEIGAFKNSQFSTLNYEIPDMKELLNNAVQLPKQSESLKFTVVGSRSHMTAETEEFLEELKIEHDEIEIISMGSSLKLCLVAEGKADVYPRFAPTMEWDTAAGQAIVQGAGKQVIAFNSGERMEYNKENLLNDWFVVK